MKKTPTQIFQSLKDKYLDESEVCMAEMLADEKVPSGMTFEEAFKMYVSLLGWSDGDKFYVVKENETIEL